MCLELYDVSNWKIRGNVWSHIIRNVPQCPSTWNIRYEQFACLRTVPDRLFGLVVRVPGYRSRGQDSIRGATRFSEK
jgi:hypothetical protein